MTFLSFRKNILFTIGMLVIITSSCEKNEDKDIENPTSYLEYSDFVTDGLIAYFPLNGDASNAFGTNGGVLNGGELTSDRFGNTIGALKFNGIDDYIELPSIIDLDGNKGTICFWIRVEDGSWDSSMAIISKIDAQGKGYCISASDSETILIKTRVDGGGECNLDFGKDFSNPNEYYFFAVTFTENKIRTFFQGEPSYGFSISSEWLFNNNHPILIGKTLLQNHQSFSGEIDDVIIYNRDLTDEEIFKLNKWR